MTNVLKQVIEERPVTTAVLGAFLAATAAESMRGIISNRRKAETGIVPYPNEQGPTCIFLPGRGQDNRAHAEALAPLLEPYGSLYFPYQCGKGYSTQTTFDQIEEICQTDGQRDRVVVATSMATMEAMKGFVEPRVTRALGEGSVKAFVVLSGITSKIDVQPSFAHLLSVSVHTPSLPLLDDLCHGYSALESHRHPQHSTMIPAESVARSRSASARMSRKVTRPQD